MARTKWEELYAKVHEDIVNLRIKPGEKISEAKLASRYGVSRAPVRNVILRLQEEGFVMIKPQAGTYVLPISEQQARDILQLRLLLEPFAAEMATMRIREDELALLDREFDRLGGLPPGIPEKQVALSEVDGLLHEIIWNRCGNAEIAPLLKKYVPAMRRIQLATLGLRASRMAPSEEEMRAILHALKKRDPDEAREVMRVHIRNIDRALNP